MSVAGPGKSLAAEIAEARWYHTIDLPGGGATPGQYDLRPIVSRLPIPASLAGKRCLDIGSRDGFYAFEMERRGAAEVVSLDISNPDDVHFPGTRPGREAIQKELDDGNRAFELAHRAIGSSVERRHMSMYRLGSIDDGGFDFAVVATLLLHLRDPIGALAAARSAISGRLLINDVVTTSVDLLRRRPVAELRGEGGRPFWWVANRAGLRRMAEAAGFAVVASGGPYLIPNGVGTPDAPIRESLRGPVRDVPRRLALRRGAPHARILAESPTA